ncbi:MAG: ATP-dependent helicase, partial [Novosphingobium sp.]|nr:ATP-dependent helicase [Novosphingobium sp.]
MAVNSFMKSSGIAALAAALAVILPVAASAQDGGQPMWRQQHQQRQQAAPERQAPPQAQAPQAQARQAQAQQPPRDGNRGGGDGGRNWNRDRGQVGVQQNAQQPGRNSSAGGVRIENSQRQNAQRNWNGGNRGGDNNRWQGNNNQNRGDANRWQGNNQNRGDNNRWQGNRDGNRNWNGDRNNNGGRWNNNWRGDNRYNWSNYRNTHRDVYRQGRYSSPYRNWSYRRLGIGFTLQP